MSAHREPQFGWLSDLSWFMIQSKVTFTRHAALDLKIHKKEIARLLPYPLFEPQEKLGTDW
jgi:hypothetical protein